MYYMNYELPSRNVSLDEGEEDVGGHGGSGGADNVSPSIAVQREIASLLQPYFTADGLVNRCLDHASTLEHIMDFTRLRALGSLFSMINQSVRTVLHYNLTHSDFPMNSEQLESYIPKALVYAMLWSFTGDSKSSYREEMSSYIRSATTITLPPEAASKGSSILDFEITVDGNWAPWSSRVPAMDVETHKVGSPDVVVPTIDTVRHESLLYTWLADHKPMVLCGPPGSVWPISIFFQVFAGN